MTCECVEARLSALIDHELDARTADEVQQHLAACPECRAEFAQMQLLVSTSQQLEPTEPPERVYWAIRRRLQTPVSCPIVTPRRVGWVLVPALATLTLMLVLFPRTHPRQETRLPEQAQISTSSPATIPEPVTELTERKTAAVPAKSSRRSETAVVARAAQSTPAFSTSRVPPVGATQAAVLRTAAVMPATTPSEEVRASLRNVQQALEEIEAALRQNPGNVQVQLAYQRTYQKGLELSARYLIGSR